MRSALAQTYDDLEVTVVDDGSTDSTLAVLGAIDDPRLRVLADGAHVGPVENFNRALATARGRYVKLLCQDDVLSPECIAHQVAAFEREPGRVVVVSGRRDIVDEQGRVLWRGRGWRGADGVIDGAAALRAASRRPQPHRRAVRGAVRPERRRSAAGLRSRCPVPRRPRPVVPHARRGRAGVPPRDRGHVPRVHDVVVGGAVAPAGR